MERPRLCCRRARWLIAGLLLLPLVGWALLLVIVPTDWARNRIVAALSEATGRPVQLEALHLGAFGRVRLSALAVGAPNAPGNPWLKVADASTDLNLLQVLAGCYKPTELQVEGLTLRVLRRKDGTLELADLLQRPKKQKRTDSSDDDWDARPTVAVRLTNATIEVVDDRSGTRLTCTGIDGSVTWTKARVTIHELHGALNGGSIELAAQLDRTGPASAFEGQVRLQNVAAGAGMNVLAYFVPVLAGTSGAIDGRLDLNVFLKGQGATTAELSRTVVGNGSVKLDPVQLDGSKMIADLGRLIAVAPQNRTASVKTDFTIKDGRIRTDDLTLQLAKTPITFTGWTGFDGTLDYKIKTEHVIEQLPGKARDFLSELQIDLKEVAIVRIQGRLDDMVVSLDGGLPPARPAGAGQSAPRLDDKERLRDLSRRLKDRFLR